MRKKSPVAVLDVGSSKMTVLIGEEGVNGTFIIKGKGESEYSGFCDGEFFEPETLKMAIGLALSNAEKQAGVHVDAIYVGTPAEFSYCDCVEVEEVYDKKIKILKDNISSLYSKALSRELTKDKTLVYCSCLWFKLDDGRRIYSAINMKTSSLKAKVSLIYIENSFISRFNKILKELDIESVEYVSSAVAEIKYLLNNSILQKGAIILDVGHLTTSVCGVIGGGCAGLGAFSLGGAHIAGDFCQAFGLSYADAQKLKDQVILSLDEKRVKDYKLQSNDNNVVCVPVSAVNQIVRERIDMIVSLFKRSLQKFSVQNLENAQLYLTGGGLSYITGSRDYLEKCLGRNIVILSPSAPAFEKPHLSSCLSVLSYALKIRSKEIL